jgi:hypothetical protein
VREKEGEGVLSDLRLTLGPPGRSAGRRRAGGNKIWQWRAQVLRGKWQRRRRLEARGLDSSYEETEDGEAHLLGTSAEAGKERNGSSR